MAKSKSKIEPPAKALEAGVAAFKSALETVPKLYQSSVNINGHNISETDALYTAAEFILFEYIEPKIIAVWTLKLNRSCSLSTGQKNQKQKRKK